MLRQGRGGKCAVMKLDLMRTSTVLSICGNSFKTGKAFHVKLVERMPSVQSCHQRKGWLHDYYMIPYVLFHSFDLFTIILHCRKQ